MENEENRGLIDKKAYEDQLESFFSALEQGKEKQAKEGQGKERNVKSKQGRVG